MLQTKDHLFDCPAEFHHSPDTKTEPSDQAILRMEQQQTAAFVIYSILHSSHIHFFYDFYSNQVLKDTKKMFRCASFVSSDQNNRELDHRTSNKKREISHGKKSQFFKMCSTVENQNRALISRCSFFPFNPDQTHLGLNKSN